MSTDRLLYTWKSSIYSYIQYNDSRVLYYLNKFNIFKINIFTNNIFIIIILFYFTFTLEIFATHRSGHTIISFRKRLHRVDVLTIYVPLPYISSLCTILQQLTVVVLCDYLFSFFFSFLFSPLFLFCCLFFIPSIYCFNLNDCIPMSPSDDMPTFGRLSLCAGHYSRQTNTNPSSVSTVERPIYSCISILLYECIYKSIYRRTDLWWFFFDKIIEKNSLELVKLKLKLLTLS